jgi:hypothetical protein
MIVVENFTAKTKFLAMWDFSTNLKNIIYEQVDFYSIGFKNPPS